jgi:hypothetical protein
MILNEKRRKRRSRRGRVTRNERKNFTSLISSSTRLYIALAHCPKKKDACSTTNKAQAYQIIFVITVIIVIYKHFSLLVRNANIKINEKHQQQQQLSPVCCWFGLVAIRYLL